MVSVSYRPDFQFTKVYHWQPMTWEGLFWVKKTTPSPTQPVHTKRCWKPGFCKTEIMVWKWLSSASPLVFYGEGYGEALWSDLEGWNLSFNKNYLYSISTNLIDTLIKINLWPACVASPYSTIHHYRRLSLPPSNIMVAMCDLTAKFVWMCFCRELDRLSFFILHFSLLDAL